MSSRMPPSEGFRITDTHLRRNAMALLLLAALVLASIPLAPPARAQTLVETIGMGLRSWPFSVAYDSSKGEVFVADINNNTVSVISDVNNAVIATVSVGEAPDGVAYDSSKGEVFAANLYSNTVSVISDATDTVVANLSWGLQPTGVAYDSGKGEVFMALSNGIVSVISDTTNAAVANVSVGNHPVGLAYDSSKHEVFVANQGGNTISVISDATDIVVANVSVGSHPIGVAYDSSRGEVFVTDNDGVSVISDTNNTVIATVSVGEAPDGVAYDSSKGEVFVANQGWGTVSVISDATDIVVANVSVGSHPTGVAYDSGKGEVFVANLDDHTISVISDRSSVTTTIPSTTTKVTCIPNSAGWSKTYPVPPATFASPADLDPWIMTGQDIITRDIPGVGYLSNSSGAGVLLVNASIPENSTEETNPYIQGAKVFFSMSEPFKFSGEPPSNFAATSYLRVLNMTGVRAVYANFIIENSEGNYSMGSTLSNTLSEAITVSDCRAAFNCPTATMYAQWKKVNVPSLLLNTSGIPVYVNFANPANLVFNATGSYRLALQILGLPVRGATLPTISFYVGSVSLDVMYLTNAECTAAVTGNSPTGTIQWALTNYYTGLFLESSGKLVGGSCSVTVYPDSVVSNGTVKIEAIYSGDARNQPSRGAFDLGFYSLGSVSLTSSTTQSRSSASTTTPTTATTSRASVSTTASITPVGSSTSLGGGSGIPEFPVQLGLSLLVTVVIVASYIATRRFTLPRTGSKNKASAA